MSDEPISSDQFKHEVEDACSILTFYGFRRAMQFESDTEVVYLGKNVAFTFAFDFREQAVDLNVTRCRDGRPFDNWVGGYSCSLFLHLVEHKGFRGPLTPKDIPENASWSQRMIAAEINLLNHPYSADLLADKPDALPA